MSISLRARNKNTAKAKWDHHSLVGGFFFGRDSMIRLVNINKIYATPSGDIPALKNINFEIGAGKIFGVVGKSGAGKSTLLRCVNLLERPTSGQVFIGEKELTQLSIANLRHERQKIGMIFQHFNLLDSKNVFQNIALPLSIAKFSKQHIHERIHQLLDLVGLSDKHNHYPRQLSGGQKQRVAIARALATEPAVLLCDEATSALDPQTTASILNLLRDINQRLQITILLITHQIEVIKQICDEVAVLENGEIIEQSETSEFFAHPKTSMAKSLVRTCLKEDLPPALQGKISTQQIPDGNTILRIFFHGTAFSQPIISHLIKSLHIEINILQANIEQIRNDTIGIMIIEVMAEQHHLQEAIVYLNQKNISVEVIGHVARAF